MQSFSETIHIINGNPYVRPPDSVLSRLFQEAKKNTSPIPVTGTINGAAFRQTLVRYQGDWRLYVNIVMAKAAKLSFSKSISEIVGREANFSVGVDPHPLVYPMVPFLQSALDESLLAQENWEKLIPSRKKEILRYFLGLKSDEAKERNLEKVIAALEGRETRFMARDWRDGK